MPPPSRSDSDAEFPTTCWRHSALILVGHGSSSNQASRLPTERLAAQLRDRGLFAEVRECFLKEPPWLDTILTDVSAATACVVPVFAGHGYLTRTVVPRAMGLSGRLTRRSGPGPQRVYYTAPIGCHPRIPDMIRRRALTILAEAGIAPRTAALLLVGHGSGRPGGSAETPEATATALRDSGDFGEVCTAYLEQEPSVRNWLTLVKSTHVVAAPLLVAEGLHGSEDLPPLFGLAAGERGPGHVSGRSVWFCGGIGASAEVADIILEQVRACMGDRR